MRNTPTYKTYSRRLTAPIIAASLSLAGCHSSIIPEDNTAGELIQKIADNCHEIREKAGRATGTNHSMDGKYFGADGRSDHPESEQCVCNEESCKMTIERVTPESCLYDEKGIKIVPDDGKCSKNDTEYATLSSFVSGKNQISEATISVRGLMQNGDTSQAGYEIYVRVGQDDKCDIEGKHFQSLIGETVVMTGNSPSICEAVEKQIRDNLKGLNAMKK